MLPSANKEIDSGATSSTTVLADEQEKCSSPTSIHSPHHFENMEQQDASSDNDEEASVLDDDIDDEESWGSLVLEAILYLPMLLMQSLWTSLHLAKSFLLGEAVLLFLEKQWWWQRCQSVLFRIDSNVWFPPSFLLLVALTVVALVVHPDGFTWVLLGKTRYVVFAADILYFAGILLMDSTCSRSSSVFSVCE